MHLHLVFCSGESLGRCQTSQDPSAPGVTGLQGCQRFKHWPPLKIPAQSWFYQSTPTPLFISQLLVKPLFLFLLQPSLSGKLSPAPVLQFSQALIARGWQECDWFVLLQSQTHFILIFFLLPYSILWVFSCLGELFCLSNLIQVSNLMKNGTWLANIN